MNSIEKLSYKYHSFKITILVPSKNSSSTDSIDYEQLVDTTHPTMIVHKVESPTIVAIILPESITEKMICNKVCMLNKSFEIYQPEKGFELSHKWKFVLNNLDEIIETNRRITGYEKECMYDADVQAKAKSCAVEYMDSVFSHMTGGRDYLPPFFCIKCSKPIETSFYSDTGLTFRDCTYEIKGQKFIECSYCNHPVAKEVFIRSMRDALLDMVAILDRDLKQQEEENTTTAATVDELDKRNTYICLVKKCLAATGVDVDAAPRQYLND